MERSDRRKKIATALAMASASITTPVWLKEGFAAFVDEMKDQDARLARLESLQPKEKKDGE